MLPELSPRERTPAPAREFCTLPEVRQAAAQRSHVGAPAEQVLLPNLLTLNTTPLRAQI